VRAVKAFQQPALLWMFDSSSQENPAAWVTRCPRFYQSAAACVVQRAGHHTLSVLDVDGVVPLKVRQLRCVVHGRSGPGVNDFVVTAPSIFKQIRDFGVFMQPRVEPLTASIVNTRGAYECALSWCTFYMHVVV
jgi:hypothetical protein